MKEAILRELLRGGQVYLLHNDVASIERMAETIRELVPEARVGVAHGQMQERQLEQIMQQQQTTCSPGKTLENGMCIPIKTQQQKQQEMQQQQPGRFRMHGDRWRQFTGQPNGNPFSVPTNEEMERYKRHQENHPLNRFRNFIQNKFDQLRR